jgi:adenylate cyclase
MSFEIERKFLVRNNEWRQHATKHCDIRQAYLTIGGKSSVRVRIRDNRTATLTVKSRPAELRRLELEYPIPILEAEALMPLRKGSIVEKERYRIPCGDLAWEIDVFSGENEGLVIAEPGIQRFEPMMYRLGVPEHCSSPYRVVCFCHDPVVAQLRDPQVLGGRQAEPVSQSRSRSRHRSATGLECGRLVARPQSSQERWTAQAQGRPQGPVGHVREWALAHLFRIPKRRRL